MPQKGTQIIFHFFLTIKIVRARRAAQMTVYILMTAVLFMTILIATDMSK